MRADDSRPPMLHIEAYPRFNVREARKEVVAGRSIISWRNRHGEMVGVGRVQIGDGNRMAIDYQFRNLGHISACQSRVTLECSIRKMDLGQEDFLTVCPKCGTRVRALLIINYDYTCNHCQSLAYRSKMVGDLVRKSERLAELERLYALGRPKGMHNRTFLKLRGERALLKLELDNHLGKARAVYDEVITACWSKEGTVAFDPDDARPNDNGSSTVRAGKDDGDEEDEGGGALLRLDGAALFAGPSLSEVLDQQLLRRAKLELVAMTAEGIVPTAMRLRKRLAVKAFLPPPELRPDDSIRIIDGGADGLLEAHYGIGFSGNNHYFLAAPDRPVRRHPVAIITKDGLLLKTRFERNEAAFIPVIMAEERALIERLLEAQREELEAYNRALRGPVRRVVEGHWAALVSGPREAVADEGPSA